MLDLTKEEAKSLEIITLYCDYKRQYGKKNTAPVFNYKKKSVIRAEWKPYDIASKLPTARARAAYAWFLAIPLILLASNYYYLLLLLRVTTNYYYHSYYCDYC